MPDGYDHGELRESWIWIDQICIDQCDESERQQQVSIMGDIYRHADVVVAWVPEVWRALQRLEKDTPTRIADYTDVQAFFASDYWSRVWV